ncbi:MAG: agmatine deiminase family protein [Kiritimatiellales bacterium]
MNTGKKRRLPAEWEPQDAVLICWPHEGTDWAPVLERLEPVFIGIAAVITRFEHLIIAAPDKTAVENKLRAAGINPARVTVCEMASNDTWARDFGPLTIYENGTPVLLDFEFNGWGGKFPAALDNQITGKLHAAGIFGTVPRRNMEIILEGGSIESDGAGTLMTTSACLLNLNRNPTLNKNEIEKKLTAEFGIEKFIWLNHGALAGDDTDAHIDTLARFCPHQTIVYMQCTDSADEHFTGLNAMENELRQLTGFHLLPLPWPKAKFDSAGNRMPVTYANFLVINGAVLVPVYNDPENDAAALNILQTAFPEREIIGIDCSEIILQHGSLHCLTMQIPEGIFNRVYESLSS